MFSPTPLSANSVTASPPTPPCGYDKPSDGFRLLHLSGDAAAPPADSDCVHVWSRPLTGPTQSGFRALLSEEECAAASRFHTPELAERYRQAHGWMRSVLSRYLDTPPETLRSGRQTPACARFAALQPGAFGFAGPARRAPRRPGRRGRRTRAPSARGHAHRLPLVLGPRDPLDRRVRRSGSRLPALLGLPRSLPQGHGRRPWAASGQLRAPPMRRYAPSGRLLPVLSVHTTV